MMITGSNMRYGFSTDLFVSRKAGGESIVVGGVAENNTRWTRVLSKRAAQTLWFHLTRHLYPEKSDMVTALAGTAPLRSSALPSITTQAAIEKLEEGYEIVGWIGDQAWSAQLSEYEAQQFWTALDIALYPVGWKAQDDSSS